VTSCSDVGYKCIGGPRCFHIHPEDRVSVVLRNVAILSHNALCASFHLFCLPSAISVTTFVGQRALRMKIISSDEQRLSDGKPEGTNNATKYV
jgi:hypothetical protein